METHEKQWTFDVPVTWQNQDFYDLDFEKVQFGTAAQQSVWRQLGLSNFYSYMYHYGRRPRPKFLEQTIEWFQKYKNLKAASATVYKMPAMTVMPEHQDHFQTYIRKNELWGYETKIRRAVIFLEDWHSGHYLEVENHAHVNWRIGQCVMWSHDAKHMAANLGHKSRFTLQITGVEF